MTSMTICVARTGDGSFPGRERVAQQPGQGGRKVSEIELVLLADDCGTSAILIVPRSRRWPAVSVNRIAPADCITGM